jgi:hypothetical protein
MLEDMYEVLALAEIRFVVGALLVVLVFRLRFDEVSEVVDEIEVVLEDHPDWSREKLVWLRERRG